VRSAVHADLSVGIWQFRRPGDRVDTIVGLVDERSPVAFGLEASARVLNDHHVAAARRLNRIENSAAQWEVLARGEPRQENWTATLRRPVDVGAQCDAVPHPRGHIEVYLDSLFCHFLCAYSVNPVFSASVIAAWS